MIKIGYLGPKGTFSYEALEKFVAGREQYVPVDFNNIFEILNAVHQGIIQCAIVPIENSLEGAINATMDFLADDMELLIVDELVMAVEQNLLVKPGTKREDISSILSHPQPLGQCRRYIDQNFSGVELRVVYSTAGAAEEVSCGNGSLAAIGSRSASRVYGLEVLESGIQDGDNNFTRFVVVSTQEREPTGDDKTSIVFSTEDQPGSLYRVLDIFNLWDINMTRIESRPAKICLGKYIFFVDIEGHRLDEDVNNALTMVKRKSSFFKFLGSYPKYRE